MAESKLWCVFKLVSIPCLVFYSQIQPQSNTKDDHVTIHGSSPKAGPEVTNNKSFSKSQVNNYSPQQHSTHAWYKLKSRFFLETLSRASSPKDMSH